VNPAELQILGSRLASVADEMGAVLRRAASSPNIKERADCSAALFTASGELLAQAEHIPVHLGSMPASVAAALATGLQTELMLNDPFAGGTHLNDLTMVAPVVVDGALVGWVANRAHHADVGGTAPGSMPPDAVTVDEEGLRLGPVPVDDAALERVVTASRTPDERRGDLDAQRGANRLGVERLAALVRALGGVEHAEVRFAEVLDHGERRMRAALRAFPRGRFAATDVLDSAGPRPEQQTPTRIVVEVRIDDDDITFDFTGTDAQRPGNVNAVEAVTVSAVAFAIRAVADPALPANDGSLRPVHVVAPPRTVVAAVPPVAVGAGNVEVSQRVADVCLAALAQARPDAVGAAGQGTMNNVLLGGGTAASAWVHYETVGGGQGGRPWADGMSGVHTAMTNTLDTPVEALERALPLRVRHYGLRRGSGGAGLHPGGDGIWRELEALAPTEVSLVTERRVTPPPGLDGGEPGAVGENWLLPGGDERSARRLPDKCTVHLDPGDVLRLLTPGGGGWGEPRAQLAQ
jgi:N-methylhydantoinase B/oxoprolinase/acetone carboxylase alpha subunit